jgi:hypothetical protein
MEGTDATGADWVLTQSQKVAMTAGSLNNQRVAEIIYL